MANGDVDAFNSAPPAVIAKALIAIQKELEPLVKSAVNDEFDSSFVPLEEVTQKAHKLLTDHQIAVLQPPSEDEHGHLAMDTILVHESGESFMRRTRLALLKADPQGHASALTYMRRYSLMGMLGLTGRGEDDDGNKASGVFAPVTEEQKDRLRSLMKYLKYPKTTIAAEMFNIKTRDHAYLAIKRFEETTAQRARDEESKETASEIEFGKKIPVSSKGSEPEVGTPPAEVDPTSLEGFRRRLKALNLTSPSYENKVINIATGVPFLQKVMDKQERITGLDTFLKALESGVRRLEAEYYAPTKEPILVDENVA